MISSLVFQPKPLPPRENRRHMLQRHAVRAVRGAHRKANPILRAKRTVRLRCVQFEGCFVIGGHRLCCILFGAASSRASISIERDRPDDHRRFELQPETLYYAGIQQPANAQCRGQGKVPGCESGRLLPVGGDCFAVSAAKKRGKTVGIGIQTLCAQLA